MTGALVGFGMGMLVCGVYLGALWLTVRQMPGTRHPGTLVLTSYLLRLMAVGTGFYGTLRLGGAAGLVAALLGFILVRQLAVRRIGAGIPQPETEGAEWS